MPLQNIPLAGPAELTYASPEKLDFGSLVLAPFRRQKTRGIAVGRTKNPADLDPALKIKPIESILFGRPLINHVQYRLIREASAYYYCNPGKLARHIIPNIPKKISSTSEWEDLPATMRKASKQMLIGHYRQRLAAYRKEIRAQTDAGFQVLMLAPEISSSIELYDAMIDEFPDLSVGLINSQTAEKEYFRTYLAALAGSARIIVGTRMAVWLGFRNLGLIIVDQENNPSHKQWDMSPRYDARTAAAFKSRIEKCRLILGASAPTVSAYCEFKRHRSRIGLLRPEGAFTLVDMREEIAKGNFSIFSQYAEEKLRAALENTSQAAVCVSQRASFSLTMCRDCGLTVRCLRCSSPLAGYADLKLRCLHCGYFESQPLKCPACGSPRIKSFGLGSERAGERLKELFPRARVRLFDQDKARTKKSFARIFQEYDTGQIDFLVGTRQILAWHPPGLSSVIFLNIDSSLNYPDYNSAQKTFGQMLEAFSGDSGSEIIIQTYSPESPLFSYLPSGQFDNFYANELEARKFSSYPPFSRIIKLIIKDSSLKKAAGRAVQTAAEIRGIINKIQRADVRLIGPMAPLVPKIRDKYFQQIVLFLPLDKDDEGIISGPLGACLRQLPPDWIIDVDPETVI